VAPGAHAGNRLAMACHGSVLLLCLALVVAARTLWPAPVEPSPIAYRNVPDEAFLKLRTHAMRFAAARAWDGFEFVDAAPASTGFQVRCKGAPVLHVEARAPHLLIRLPLDARQRAPAIVHLQATLQWPLKPLPCLEQVLAGVREPTVMDRLRLVWASAVPAHERCGGQE
jgi:hypothetical protein